MRAADVLQGRLPTGGVGVTESRKNGMRIKIGAVWAAACSIVLAAFVGAQTSGVPSTNQPERAWVDLVEDQSRSQLAAYEMLRYAPPGEKNVRRSFVFPSDANDGLYGIDVSHHNGRVDWKRISSAGVRFVYIKAGQGATFRDPQFDTNWRGSSDAGIRRGAYHFLTAGVDGAEQARSYLALVKSSGGLEADDLTPVVDLEWDFEKIGNVKVDRWARLSSQQIAQIVKAWLDEVNAVTGRRPMIYTAASWWTERMGGSLLLKEHPHWIADYRQSSINRGAPVSVKQHPYIAWQFTDIGTLDGLSVKFDVNRLKGKDLGALSGK